MGCKIQGTRTLTWCCEVVEAEALVVLVANAVEDGVRGAKVLLHGIAAGGHHAPVAPGMSSRRVQCRVYPLPSLRSFQWSPRDWCTSCERRVLRCKQQEYRETASFSQKYSHARPIKLLAPIPIVMLLHTPLPELHATYRTVHFYKLLLV